MLLIAPAKTVRLLLFSFVLCLAHHQVSAQKKIEHLLLKLASEKNDSLRLNTYHDIGEYYRYSQPDSASYHLQNGIKYFAGHNYKTGVAALTNQLGGLEADHGHLDIARRRQMEALKIFEELKSKKGIGMVHNALGVLEGMRGNNDSAVKHFFITLKAYQELSYTSGIIATYTNLGRINAGINNLDKALEYYNKALALIVDPNAVSGRCNLYNNIGIIYGRKGDMSKALDFLQRALNLSNKEEYIDIYVYSLLNMGIVYHELGQQSKALAYLNDALKIAKEKGMTGEYAKLLINIANITGETDAPKAIEQMKEALAIVKQQGDKTTLEDVYLALAQWSKKIGDYKYTVSVMEEYREYQDSTSGLEKATEIANLQAVYELEQSNNKLTQLQLTDQTHALKRNILITIVVCLAIFIVFILLYLNKTKQLNETLSKKEAELTAANSIKDRLFSIIGHDLRSPIGNITMILDLLEEQTTNPEDEKLLHSLKDQASASLETLDKLLYWGKSQISGSRVESANFVTDDFISKNIKLLKGSIEQKQLSIVNNVLLETKINGDPSHFDFIIRNLLSNAIKFTRPSGTIEISIDTKSKTGYTVFAVKDNGVGIKQDRIHHIFEPLGGNTIGTAQEKGTGIGLMLCKEFVLENDGEIWVESTEGQGTTFYFSFKNAR